MDNLISNLKYIFYITAGALLQYMHISQEIFLAYSALIAIDTIVALVERWINKKPITSHEMGSGIIKKCLTLIVPLTLALVAKGAGMDGNYVGALISTVMSGLTISEGYSIIGHIYTIHTGEKIPELDVFRIILKKILDFIRQDATKSNSN